MHTIFVKKKKKKKRNKNAVVQYFFFFSDFECPRNMIKCNDQKRCIYPSSLCDGVNQCIDGSDENEATCKGIKLIT